MITEKREANERTFLFFLQSQVNEDLLQFLIDVVNANLLKAVVLNKRESEPRWFKKVISGGMDWRTSKISKP